MTQNTKWRAIEEDTQPQVQSSTHVCTYVHLHTYMNMHIHVHMQNNSGLSLAIAGPYRLPEGGGKKEPSQRT